MVNSGATYHLSRYKKVLSNVVVRESNLKIILGDNSTHFVKVFGSIKFDLNLEESIFIHDVMYVPRLKNIFLLIFSLEDKGMRVTFTRGKVLTWPIGSPMRDAFTL